MLVDNDVYINKYVADGSTASFPIAFPFLEASHIEVYTRGEDGEDVLVDPSTYTITGEGVEAGGKLTFNTPPTAGTVIAIIRNVPITQLYAYTELDNFPAESHENALAKLTMIDQQQAEILGRAITIPVTSNQTPEQFLNEFKSDMDAAVEAAQDAASDAAESKDVASAILAQCREIADSIVVSFNNEMVTVTMTVSADVAAGTLLTLPEDSGRQVQYEVGSHALQIFYNGAAMFPGSQYEEVGTEGDASDEVKLLQELRAGDELMFHVFGLDAASLVDGESITWDPDTGLSVNIDELGDYIAPTVRDQVDEVIGEDLVDYQKTNTRTWSAGVDYNAGALVSGSNGSLYVALTASGPSTTAVNPISGDDTVWKNLSAGDTINVRYFGAKGDGVTDDTAALNAAMTAAEGKVLYIPAGTYLTTTGLAIPSNTEVRGDGMWNTLIKLSDDAPYANHCIRNTENVWNRDVPTQYVTDNHGNENIILRDLSVDGNAWNTSQQSGVNHFGCAIQFAYVKKLLIENVRAYNGKLHCIDISSAQYADNDGPNDEGWYYGASENVRIVNVVCYDSYMDDALTTHWSHDITIVNPIIYRTLAHPLHSSTTHGLEIDDGSYRVYVYGGHVSDHNCGLQVKGHIDNVYFPAHDVMVDGLVCKANKLNFWTTHAQSYKSSNSIDYAPIRNITLRNCTSIKPTLPPKEADADYYQATTISHLFLSDVCGGLIQSFMIIGDDTTDVGGFGVRFTGRSENIQFNNLEIYNTLSTYGLIYIQQTTDDGLKFFNTVVRNCGAHCVFYIGDVTYAGVEIDGVDASRTASVGDSVALIEALYSSTMPGTNALDVKNIYNYTGYSRILGEIVQGVAGPLALTQTKRCEASFSNVKRIHWTRAAGSGGSSSSTRTLNLGYQIGNQNVGVGEGNAIGFYAKHTTNDATEVAYIGSYKSVSGPDTDMNHGLVFATRSDTGTSGPAVIRWQISDVGHLLPQTGNTYNIGASSQAVNNLYTKDGTVKTSDGRVKANAADVPEDVLRAWGKVSLKVFQFIDSIGEKGVDGARLHAGVIAQEVQSAFESEGLDAGRYGLFCYDQWDAVVDEEGNIISPAGDSYAIRYDEALVLEAAYQRWRANNLRDRVAVLERKMEEMEQVLAVLGIGGNDEE